MTKETMNIHKALSELKILEDRIFDAVNDITSCCVNKHSNSKINGVSVEDYEKIIIGKYDKANDLISRRNAIKKAVVLSNAKTIVTINGITYTVAEAIEMKNHGIESKQSMLRLFRDQYSKCQTTLERRNGSELEEKCNNYIISLFGTKEAKTSSDEIEKAKKLFMAQNTYDFIDPLNIVDKIKELEDEISAFQSEVDSILSTSNAITVIEVEY